LDIGRVSGRRTDRLEDQTSIDHSCPDVGYGIDVAMDRPPEDVVLLHGKLGLQRGRGSLLMLVPVAERAGHGGLAILLKAVLGVEQKLNLLRAASLYSLERTDRFMNAIVPHVLLRLKARIVTGGARQERADRNQPRVASPMPKATSAHFMVRDLNSPGHSWHNQLRLSTQLYGGSFSCHHLIHRQNEPFALRIAIAAGISSPRCPAQCPTLWSGRSPGCDRRTTRPGASPGSPYPASSAGPGCSPRRYSAR